MAQRLKFAKTILSKVSFCPDLLKKEYVKCRGYLTASERSHFDQWVKKQAFATLLNKNGV